MSNPECAFCDSTEDIRARFTTFERIEVGNRYCRECFESIPRHFEDGIDGFDDLEGVTDDAA